MPNDLKKHWSVVVHDVVKKTIMINLKDEDILAKVHHTNTILNESHW